MQNQSPANLSYDTKELRHDKTLLQRATHLRLYNSTEARLPRVFPRANSPACLHRSYAPSVWACVSRVIIINWGSDTIGLRRSDGRVESEGLGSKSSGSDEGEDPSRWGRLSFFVSPERCWMDADAVGSQKPEMGRNIMTQK